VQDHPPQQRLSGNSVMSHGDLAVQLGAGAAAAGVVARRRWLRGLQIRQRSTDPGHTR